MKERNHLKSCTIVPDDYYVERSADRQIQSIIDDMERPGYVLVARQMGKTNLLLHTMKVMQNEQNIFVYIDFTSFTFDSERECLEYIIDTALEMNGELFAEEQTIIAERRREYPSNPTKQFTAEIKLLLNKVEKLVLVFDEIDALTRCPFSDHIFSQIRSHYFQRVNFPIFYKLTYVLSGVIEPKDIIKDPDISPFNIGEKIYLKDFTREEFYDFTKRIEFDGYYSHEILDRIYYWTCGHPRMTWDVCLEVERTGHVTTIKDLDEIVKNLYLVSFDHAPIDSIRRMVEKNPTLIDAVLELSIKKGQSISKDIRNKLYLAGVVDYSDTDVYFKNPIMEKSLPYNWLISLQTSENAYLQKALEFIYVEKNYKEAIAILKTIADTAPYDLKSRIMFHLGIAHFRQYQNAESRRCMESIKEDDTEYYEAIYWNASNLMAMELPEEAIAAYNKVIGKSDDTNLVALAKIGKADTLMSFDEDDKMTEAKDILIGLLKQMDRDGVDLHHASVVNYDLAEIESHFGNNQRALSFIDQAINFAQPNERPILLYKKILFMPDNSEKEKAVVAMIDSLRVVVRKPDVEDFESMLGINQYYLALIFSLIILDYPQYLGDIQDKIKLLYERQEDAYITISKLLEHGKKKMESYKFAQLMENHYEEGRMDFSDDQILWIYSILLANCKNSDEVNNRSDKVFGLLEKSKYDGELPLNISHAFINILNRAIPINDNKKIIDVILLYRKYFGRSTNEQVQQNLILFYFRLANVAYLEGRKQEFYENAIEYMRMIKMLEYSRYLSKDVTISITTMKELVRELYKLGKDICGGNIIEHLLELKYGKLDNNTRIEIYDKVRGEIVVNKYKHLKEMILGGFGEIQKVV